MKIQISSSPRWEQTWSNSAKFLSLGICGALEKIGSSLSSIVWASSPRLTQIGMSPGICGAVEKIISSFFIHCLSIIASLCTDTIKPHPAANFFLVQSGLFLLCFFAAYNPDRHVRSFWQLFQASTPSEVPVPVIDVDKLPLHDPHLFDLVELIESDSSSDEDDHWPPGFPNELWLVRSFTACSILAPFPQNILHHPVKQRFFSNLNRSMGHQILRLQLSSLSNRWLLVVNENCDARFNAISMQLFNKKLNQKSFPSSVEEKIQW